MPCRFPKVARIGAIVVLIAGAVATSAVAQTRHPKNPPSKPSASAPASINVETAARFVGIWTAEFNETTFLRLELTFRDGSFAGTIATGNIHTAEDGRLTDVSEPERSSAMFDVAMDGDVLTFKRKDGDDVDRLQMTLTGKGSAELRFIFPDEQNGPRVQPFELTRRMERAR